LSKEFMSQIDFDLEPLPPEELLRLNIGQAYCKIGKSAFPFNVPKMSDQPDRDRARVVIERSREQYGIPRIDEFEDKRQDRPEIDDDPLADIDPGGVFD